MAEDTPGWECPHDDFGIRPRTGTIGISEDGVPARNIESPSGGGVRSLPGVAENCLPVMFPTAPVPSANGPQLGSWRVAVVRVEEPCDLPPISNVGPTVDQRWNTACDLPPISNVGPT